MSLSKGSRRASGSVHTQPDQPQAPSGQVVLFIAAVLVAGMTCVLYLWQQSRIVAANQDITNLNAQLITQEQQRDDLLAQVNRLQAVTHVVAMANKLGMVQANPLQFKQVTITMGGQPPVVAALSPNQPSAVVLPATNAAIPYWWQDAWDGMFSLLQ
ncbi:MAG: septum formation initiator family protein [Chloroflexota bacterium]